MIDRPVKATGTVRRMAYRFDTVPEVRDGLKRVHYLADEGIAGVVFLADRLQKPILVEEPSVEDAISKLTAAVANATGLNKADSNARTTL